MTESFFTKQEFEKFKMLLMLVIKLGIAFILVSLFIMLVSGFAK